ncbi:MAG: hypothetical protein JWO83_1397 [Caulobacteraceae bacterium]|jgi:hypothetical protein|nr:hypothetical protein [Caulobacteraceae bacterium]
MLRVDIPTLDEFKALAALRREACVSIYEPTSPLPDQAKANRTLFKDMVKEALRQLREAGVDKREIEALTDRFDALLGKPKESLDDNKYRVRGVEEWPANEMFWEHQARGLGVLATSQSLDAFRLSVSPKPLAEVADRFHLVPLVRVLSERSDLYVLALSAHEARLLHVYENMPPVRVPVPDSPGRVEEQWGAVHHDPDLRLRLRQYARALDKALHGALAGRTTPLVLAAAEPMAALFREVNSYPHLVEDVIPGAPDHLSDRQLEDAAIPIMDRLYQRELQATLALYDELRPRRATTDVSYAAHAATAGGVSELVVDLDVVIPGVVSEIDGSVSYASADNAGTYSVVDEIARRALITDAKVLAARQGDLPGGAALVAILRYEYGVIQDFPQKDQASA